MRGSVVGISVGRSDWVSLYHLAGWGMVDVYSFVRLGSLFMYSEIVAQATSLSSIGGEKGSRWELLW